MNPIDLSLVNLNNLQKKQVLLQKLQKAPGLAFKDKDLVQVLDRSKETVTGKQAMARVNSGVFIGGS